MAIPNIVSVSSIYGTTVVSVLTTTLTTTLVTAASDKILKINLIRCTNITDSDATVTFDIEVSGTHKMLANEITVPANSVVDIIDKNSSVYLQETDLIRGGASSGSAIDCVISSTIIVAEMSSIFSKREAEMRDPNSSSKNFSPGRVKTIFLTERAIAFSFLSPIRSKFRGFA